LPALFILKRDRLYISFHRPRHCKKASDLLALYLGESEKNMARAFEAARQEQAILLIDEVDSFLRDRTLATRSWEVSQVNEFLTQMESFPGIFIASTNLKENLDPASLRRFDLKLLFDFLLPGQSLRLPQSHSKALNLTPPTDEDIHTLQNLPNATPGDFANVARQCRFQPRKTASCFLQLLIQECEIKAVSNSRKIGFLG
jgi:AAA+ superfamily predicted ATPase